jgi:plasmid replication initiation protein
VIKLNSNDDLDSLTIRLTSLEDEINRIKKSLISAQVTPPSVDEKSTIIPIESARYNYTELQLDIFIQLLIQLSHPKPNRTYELFINELAQITGKKYNYNYIQEIVQEMEPQLFEVNHKQYQVFDSIEYRNGQGYILFNFSKLILPSLFALRARYTLSQLKLAFRLSSKYAKRIYLYCLSKQSTTNEHKMSIQQFKSMLNIIDTGGHEKFYNISDLKRSVLDLSVKAINKRTNLQINYFLIKRGRSFEHIVFQTKGKPQREV